MSIRLRNSDASDASAASVTAPGPTIGSPRGALSGVRCDDISHGTTPRPALDAAADVTLPARVLAFAALCAAH